MHYFVHGVDRDHADGLLLECAESHWAYMDVHADALVARGPTLSVDGARHTGSVHVVEAASLDDARRFAFEEPYWLAGVYTSVTVSCFRSARVGTMWDRPSQEEGAVSSLVLVRWQGSFADADGQVLGALADIDAMVFGGLLASDDGSRTVGLVAGVDVESRPAATLVAGVGLPVAVTSVTSVRWRRGGRPQG